MGANDRKEGDEEIVVLDEFHSNDPEFHQWLDHLIEKATLTGYTKTRLEYLEGMSPKGPEIKAEIAALREKINQADAEIKDLQAILENRLVTKVMARHLMARVEDLAQQLDRIATEKNTKQGLSLTAQTNHIALAALLVALVSASCSALVGIFTILNILKVFP